MSVNVVEARIGSYKFSVLFDDECQDGLPDDRQAIMQCRDSLMRWMCSERFEQYIKHQMKRVRK